MPEEHVQAAQTDGLEPEGGVEEIAEDGFEGVIEGCACHGKQINFGSDMPLAD